MKSKLKLYWEVGLLMESGATHEHKESDGTFGIVKSKVKLESSAECVECIFEGFLRCCYEIKLRGNELVNIEYLLTIGSDKFRQYGIKAVMRNKHNDILDCSVAENRFATITECIIKMQMLARDKVLPCTLPYVI